MTVLARRLFCCLLVALFPRGVAAQQDPWATIQRQVITAADIRAAGVRYLSDAVALADGWDATSIDGFTWQLSTRGLSPFGQPTWTVLVDGQPIDLNLFGVRSLNRLPVTVGQVDSIEAIGVPASADGVLAPGGLLRIHTKRPDNGWSLSARAFTGSETGDPGPYRFTEAATSNIDRIGSGISGQLQLGGRRAHVTATAAWQEHFVSDPLIRARNLDISTGNYPIIQESLAGLSAGYASPSGSHRLFIGRSAMRDYFFLEPFGREVPVQSELVHAGLDGELELSATTDLRYRLGYATNDLDEHPNTLGADFDWALRRWFGQLFAVPRLGTMTARLGASVETRSARTGDELSDDDVLIFRLGGDLVYPLGTTLTQRFALQLTSAGADPGLELALTHRWQPRPGHSLEATLSYLERIPETDGRIWFWQRRGYGFLSDNATDASIEDDLSEVRTVSADLRWLGALLPRLSALLGVYFRSTSGLALEEQLYQLDAVTQAFAGPLRLTNHQGGELAGAEVGLVWTSAPGTRIRSHYRYQSSVSGDALFKESWRAIPAQTFSLQATHTPWPSVSLWARLRYRSATRWEAYAEAAAQSAGVYSSRVPEATTLDAGAQKWLWRGRLRVQLTFRDILNEAVPDHPIGAAFGLSFAVQAELVSEAGE